MAMFSFRGKPGWESHDAAERAAAVATSTDPALLARLTDLARSDEAAGVRRAAVRRLLDLPLLGDRARNDADPEVRAAAQERYRQLLAGIGEQPLPLADRERVLRSEDSPELLAWMAVNSPEPVLRRMALEQHAKPGLLLDRCQRDPDPAIRLWLLEQISDLAALERIAEATRKSDKRLSHAARERAEMLRFATGDAEALKRRALAIAESLDQLRRERPHDLQPRAATLHAEWEALAARVDPAIVQRVQGYIDTLAAVLAPARELPVIPAQADEPVGLPTIEASAETAVEQAAPATPRDPRPRAAGPGAGGRRPQRGYRARSARRTAPAPRERVASRARSSCGRTGCAPALRGGSRRRADAACTGGGSTLAACSRGDRGIRAARGGG